MAENSKIEWTHHTFNPWRGCTKVSTGCANCYAETMSKRNPSVLGVWGDHGTRVVASESAWREPLKWSARAIKEGKRERVFCASLADVFEDRPELAEPRRRLLDLITRTQHSLDWLLLTKRPENIDSCLRRIVNPRDLHKSAATYLHEGKLRNIWLGVSVENQEQADKRIPLLLQTPAAVRFLSCEPLLGPVNLDRIEAPSSMQRSVNGGLAANCLRSDDRRFFEFEGHIDWVIVGGESGHGARLCDAPWISSLVRQCKDAGVACFVKQLGAAYRRCNGTPVKFSDRKGGVPEEWPEDLRVRQFPKGVA